MLFNEESEKATQFIQLANQIDIPLVFLQNTTGYMVGQEYEQRGIIKDGAKMINAVTNTAVPHLTINMARRYGAGNYGMCGRAYGPRFLFAWPNAKTAVMGPQQLAGVLSIVARQSAAVDGPAVRRGGRRGDAAAVEEQIESESLALFMTGRVYDDGIIDPRDTRTVLGMCLSVDRQRRGPGPARLRRVPDVMRVIAAPARRQPGRDRLPHHPHVPAARHRARSPSTATPTPTRRSRPHARRRRRACPATPPADTYLRGDLLVDAATRAGADAVHPGYGFLSETAAFAEAVVDAGLTWVGPPPAAIAAMGSKIGAKAMMRAAGVPVLARLDASRASTRERAARCSSRRRPAAAGGACASCAHAGELADAVAGAEREAAAAFGDGTVFVERYVERGRHVEIQVFADTHGNVVALFERECSIQRRHQKIIEECPSPAVDAELRRRWATPPSPRPAPSATSAPARSSSSSSRTASSPSSR